jgi:hypothetical protein
MKFFNFKTRQPQTQQQPAMLDLNEQELAMVSGTKGRGHGGHYRRRRRHGRGYGRCY